MLLIFAVLAILAPAETVGRSRESFNNAWRFDRFGPMPDGTDRSEPEGLSAFDLNDSEWRGLDLPHDWGIEGPFRQDLPGNTGKLPWAGIGWYRKHFTLPASEQGKRVFLDFDGAMSDATIFLNGQKIGGWPYGYASFRVELTDALRLGDENVLAVRLDNRPDSSRWYPGGGIYRNVWLVKTNPVHVSHRGVFVTTPDISDDRAAVEFAVSIDNQSEAPIEVTIVTEILLLEEGSTSIIASTGKDSLRLEAGETKSVTQRSVLKKPMLWSPDSPSLYLARTRVIDDNSVFDQYETHFGVRSIEFTADRGFLLNGKETKFKGVCLHHDLGPLGSAIHTRGIERQIELLQEMGCNAIRTSHNPPAPELLDLCDRMGMLVQVEAFDCWSKGKTPNDYGRFFDEWHERDLVSMIHRDRNHPSVVMWSTGNEVREQNNKAGQGLSQRLSAIVTREDPTRPVSAGCNRPKAGFDGFQKTVDVFGFNYKPHLYERFRKRNPDQPFYSSESSSCISSRGEYFFPVIDDKSGGRGGRFQVSSYDLYAPFWAMRPDVEFVGQDTVPGVMGEFVWTGFDYLGEPTPYNKDFTNLLNASDPVLREIAKKELEELGEVSAPSRSSYFGILDLCGFKKDRFYLYQSRWRSELPMAHILPHWSWPERVGKVTPVHVYTSGDEAELFLNGRSLGRKKKGQNEYRLVWEDVVYEPGELRVVAYKKGKQWANAKKKTAGAPASLELSVDRKEIEADGQDISYITVQVRDHSGLPVPRANNLVHFEIDGPAEIVAVGNGDATSHQPFQSNQITSYNGMCLVIVRSLGNTEGAVTIRASSEGLPDRQIVIHTSKTSQSRTTVELQPSASRSSSLEEQP